MSSSNPWADRPEPVPVAQQPIKSDPPCFQPVQSDEPEPETKRISNRKKHHKPCTITVTCKKCGRVVNAKGFARHNKFCMTAKKHGKRNPSPAKVEPTTTVPVQFEKPTGIDELRKLQTEYARRAQQIGECLNWITITNKD